MSEYDDIINLPHHVSKTRPRMSLRARAGQFAPFAALTGHGAALSETARLTERPPCLTDSVLKKLDETLAYVREHAEEGVRVSVTYYVPTSGKKAAVTTCCKMKSSTSTRCAVCSSSEAEKKCPFLPLSP